MTKAPSLTLTGNKDGEVELPLVLPHHLEES